VSGRSYNIGVIPGDGVGPEVTAEALKVLASAADRFGFRYDTTEYPWSGRHYLETGELMPEAILDEYRQLDTLLLGAIGDPRVERGKVEHAVIMTTRLGLDLYLNLRPIVLFDERLCPLKGVQPSQVDMRVVRENTEDAYVGVGGTIGLGTARETAIAEMVYTRIGVERCVRYAFELARSRPRRTLTLVDKSNAIRPQEIWRRVTAEIGREFPDVAWDALYVDAAAMFMIANPARFDVIVTTNLFGDILTDLGAVIQGGLGSAASANLHPGKTSLFEPIHGSAPDIAGTGTASPVGAILACAMMLDFLGESDAADAVDSVIRDQVVRGEIRSLDARSGLSTAEIGDRIAHAIAELPAERSARGTVGQGSMTAALQGGNTASENEGRQ
jgi:3-isopropylmalate dehydrogenase